MSNELVLNGSVQYYDAQGVADALGIVNLIQSVTTAQVHRVKQLVTTSAALVNLGGISAPGYALFKNLDATNYVQLLTATAGGKVIARLLPGGFALLYLDTDMQAPALKANTASCWVDILLVSQ